MIRSIWIFSALTLLFLGSCQVAGKAVRSRGLLPTPGAVAQAIADNHRPLLLTATTTLGQSSLGLLLATLAAVSIVCTAARFPAFEQAITPYVIMLKATPALAFVPLIMSVCGGGLLGKAAIAGIIAFLPLVVGGLTGLREVPAQLGDLRRHCQPDHWKYFTTIAWPYALNGFCVGLKMAGPMAVVGAIVGEFVMGGESQGLGAFIMSAYSSIKMPNVAGAGVIATGIGVGLFGLAHVAYKVIREKNNLAR